MPTYFAFTTFVSSHALWLQTLKLNLNFAFFFLCNAQINKGSSQAGEVEDLGIPSMAAQLQRLESKYVYP
jgi:hypothetical protein